MSEITLRTDVFPQAVPKALAVGDRLRVVCDVTVSKIEADLVDVTQFGSSGGSQTILGATTVTMQVQNVEAHA